jgi:hypothetical protein
MDIFFYPITSHHEYKPSLIIPFSTSEMWYHEKWDR